MKQSLKHPVVLLLLLGLCSFLPFLGFTHLFDWDEINFAESAREMMVTGDYLRVRINFEPFWEKPPLFFWLQVIGMKVWGVNEFAARLPNAIMGIITLLTLYLIGKKERDETFGMLWALLYAGSILPHLYFRSGIIDPVFNYFIFLGIYFLNRTVHTETKTPSYAAWAGAATGASILTKGPVGFLLVLLTFLVIWGFKGLSKRIAHLQEVLIFAVSVFLVSCIWFGWETIQNGPWYLVEFINYQIELFRQPVAGHAQPWYYHAVVVFIGCFPISIFGLKRLFGAKDNQSLDRWMIALFWVVMLLFSYVTTKIVHYSSMAYLPLSLLATREVHHWITTKKPRVWMQYLYLVFGVIWSSLIGLAGWAISHPGVISRYLTGQFPQESLKVGVVTKGWEGLIGLVLLLATLMVFQSLRKHNYRLAFWSQAVGLSVTLTLVTRFILPSIENFSQGPAVSFFEQYVQQDVYLMTEGHKSYAPFFYGKVQPYATPEATDKKWLLTGTIDKPVYIAVKVNKVKRMEQYPDIRRLYQRGGFVFYERLPAK